MTVLIAAAGADGRRAHSVLADAGFDVEHITTLSAARVRAATVDVLVVGALEDGTARDLCDAVRGTAPVVHLGRADGFETAVEQPFDDGSLAATVRIALGAREYRRAVDALYERCRERAAAAEASDATVTAAKRRAQEAFRETHDIAERTPYEHLFEGVTTSTDTGDVSLDEKSTHGESDSQT